MATRNDKQEDSKEKINKKRETEPAGQETSLKSDTDMQPDEFLAPNADTDLPIEHHVANDAVLRGEDHADEKVENLPSPVKKNKADEGKK